MSKRHNRRRTPTLERATSIPSGGNIISPAQIQAIIAQMNRPGKVSDNSDMFSPGASMDVQQGANPKGLPRLWQYPLATNTMYPDRAMGNPEIPAFQQLRNLATLCDGIALCEKVWLDLIPKLTIKIQLRPDLEEQGANLKDFQKEVTAYSKFFEKPDGINDFHSWLRIAIVEQTQIDALYIYKQRDRAGRLLKLPIIQGDTLKPLLDDWGAIVAYQQFPWGIPGEVYSTKDMIYFRESPQANTPYGRSRVERAMIRINQALRKSKKDLSHYTEGNQPFAIMEVPEASNWTPDQVDAFEQMWNALTAGSSQQQVRMRFTQPGMKYTKLEDYQLTCEFDKFLLNCFAASYGLGMGDISFTETIHKSADEGQQNMLFRRTLFPLTAMYSMICTNILRDDFHDDRFIFGFGGYEEVEDLATLSVAYGGFLDRGVISPSDVAHAMKFPDIPQTGPLLITKNGITPLASFEEGSEARKASDDAQLAGLKLAANPQQPGQLGQGTSDDGEEESATTPVSSSKPVPGKAAPSKVERHTPGGHEHDQKTHGDRVHPEYGVKHDKTPANKQAMKLSEAQLQVAQARAALKKASRADKPAARIALKKAQANLHAVRLKISADKKAAKAKVHAAKVEAAADKKEAAAHTKEEKAEAKAAATKARAEIKAEKAEAKAALAHVKVQAKAAKTHRASGLEGDIDEELWYESADEDDAFDVEDYTVEELEDWLAIEEDAVLGDDEVSTEDEEPRYTITELLSLITHSLQASTPAATEEEPIQAARERHMDLKRWQKRALEDVERQRAYRGFTTLYIPADEHGRISEALVRCCTADEVREVFSRVRDEVVSI
jgi:hypothetical protein